MAPEKIEKLLAQTVVTAQQGGLVGERYMQRVNVDTTVQEKAVAHLTDARLYHKARRALVRAARRAGIELRQSFERLGERDGGLQGRYPSPAEEAGSLRDEASAALPGAGDPRHAPQMRPAWGETRAVAPSWQNGSGARSATPPASSTAHTPRR